MLMHAHVFSHGVQLALVMIVSKSGCFSGLSTHFKGLSTPIILLINLQHDIPLRITLFTDFVSVHDCYSVYLFVMVLFFVGTVI